MSEIKNSPVKGYRDQSKKAVDTVNRNKEYEEEILSRLDALYVCGECDARWLEIAENHIEQGFMAMNRAVFKPKRISE